ncbi:MAG TPA: hypothetical protein VMW72_11425 [Sedimentisphaerales bacterium]|nr:hypothetical protein [Sedimentisphaerales bacterium]
MCRILFGFIEAGISAGCLTAETGGWTPEPRPVFDGRDEHRQP